MRLEALVNQLEALALEAEAARINAPGPHEPEARPKPAGSDQISGHLDASIPGDELASWGNNVSNAQIERLARFVAIKGRADAERLLAIASRAIEFLSDPRLEKSMADEAAASQNARFPWELSNEQFPPGTPVSIFLASVDDYTTGEGLTCYFAAGYGRSETEFRKRLAVEWGAGLADRARLACGAREEVPFASLFVSPALRAALRQLEQREDGPGSFSFFARHHANYS